MYCCECGTLCDMVGIIPTFHIGEPHRKYVCSKCGWTNDPTPVPTKDGGMWVYETPKQATKPQKLLHKLRKRNEPKEDDDE